MVLSKLFRKVFLTESAQEFPKTVALVGGSFKPPHAGHWYMVEQYAKKADEVVILISDPKSAKSIRKPAGTPSSTPPIAAPCDSPKEVKLHLSPNVLAIFFTFATAKVLLFCDICKNLLHFCIFICACHFFVVILQRKIWFRHEDPGTDSTRKATESPHEAFP